MKKTSMRFNFIASAIVVALIMLAAGILGDYYFDLNDDVLMKDILSGAYTGVPEGHNIQMLYPISAFVSLFYKAARGVSWYGIFLCFLQYLCVFLVTIKSLRIVENSVSKAMIIAFSLLFSLGVIGAHLLFVQYTFTCGMLSATAAFLILAHERGKDRNLVTAVVLICIAYLLRSEMLLLTLPIVGVAILIKWLLIRNAMIPREENGIPVCRIGERKSHFKHYALLCVAIVAVIAVSQGMHMLGYMSPEWKEFNRLFDARTELYDFQYIPDYQENREFYDSIGLSQGEQELLINYNFGIDDEINADTLNAVASYADKQKTDSVPLPIQLVNAVPEYVYRLHHMQYQQHFEYPSSDFPWNLLVIALYIMVFLAYIIPGKEKIGGEGKIATALLVLLFACRSTLWLYIIVRGRTPIRITHPLYLMEIAVLFGMLLIKRRNDAVVLGIFTGVLVLIAAFSVPDQLQVVKSEMHSRDLMRDHYDALYGYFKENSDKFYFVDVYTSVSCGKLMESGEETFSEKMFVNVDNTLANHELMGGWSSKSPLYYKKLKAYGFDSMENALVDENVFFVQNITEDVSWLQNYYREKGIGITIDQIDVVSDVFGIYKVVKK